MSSRVDSLSVIFPVIEGDTPDASRERSFLACGEHANILVLVKLRAGTGDPSLFSAVFDSLTVTPVSAQPLQRGAPPQLAIHRMKSVESLLSEISTSSHASTGINSQLSSMLGSPRKSPKSPLATASLSPAGEGPRETQYSTPFAIDATTVAVPIGLRVDSEQDFVEARAAFRVTVYEHVEISLISSFLAEPRLGAAYIRRIVDESKTVTHRLEAVGSVEKSIPLKRLISAELQTEKKDARNASLTVKLTPHNEVAMAIAEASLNIHDASGGLPGLVSRYKLMADECFVLDRLEGDVRLIG